MAEEWVYQILADKGEYKGKWVTLGDEGKPYETIVKAQDYNQKAITRYNFCLGVDVECERLLKTKGVQEKKKCCAEKVINELFAQGVMRWRVVPDESAPRLGADYDRWRSGRGATDWQVYWKKHEVWIDAYLFRERALNEEEKRTLNISENVPSVYACLVEEHGMEELKKVFTETATIDIKNRGYGDETLLYAYPENTKVMLEKAMRKGVLRRRIAAPDAGGDENEVKLIIKQAIAQKSKEELLKDAINFELPNRKSPMVFIKIKDGAIQYGSKDYPEAVKELRGWLGSQGGLPFGEIVGDVQKFNVEHPFDFSPPHKTLGDIAELIGSWALSEKTSFDLNKAITRKHKDFTRGLQFLSMQELYLLYDDAENMKMELTHMVNEEFIMEFAATIADQTGFPASVVLPVYKYATGMIDQDTFEVELAKELAEYGLSKLSKEIDTALLIKDLIRWGAKYVELKGTTKYIDKLQEAITEQQNITEHEKMDIPGFKWAAWLEVLFARNVWRTYRDLGDARVRNLSAGLTNKEIAALRMYYDYRYYDLRRSWLNGSIDQRSPEPDPYELVKTVNQVLLSINDTYTDPEELDWARFDLPQQNIYQLTGYSWYNQLSGFLARPLKMYEAYAGKKFESTMKEEDLIKEMLKGKMHAMPKRTETPYYRRIIRGNPPGFSTRTHSQNQALQSSFSSTTLAGGGEFNPRGDMSTISFQQNSIGGADFSTQIGGISGEGSIPLPKLPSVGFPSIGEGGAAMRSSTIDLLGFGGGSVPTLSSSGGMGGGITWGGGSRGFAGGGLGAGFNLGGERGGGAFPSGGGTPGLGGTGGMGTSGTGMPDFGAIDQSISRLESVVNLFNAPDVLSANLGAGMPGQKQGGFLSQLFGQQQPQPQIVHRFEKGSVQVHTQKLSPQKIFNMFLAELAKQSRTGTNAAAGER